MCEKNSPISAIAAISSNGMLGANGWLPWDIPEDVAYFERMIEGAALVVGRLTYGTMTAFPVDTFVVSRQKDLFLHPGSYRVDSVETALLTAKATGKPVFVIGGAGIYEAAWPYCHDFYLTKIDRPFAGDTRFPDSVPFARWAIVHEEQKTFRERTTGEEVMCHFMHYVQSAPLLPENFIANYISPEQNRVHSI